MKYYSLLILLPVVALAERPKVKDTDGNILVKFEDIPVGYCGNDGYFGLGIVNGTLEKCEEYNKPEAERNPDYEDFRCKSLRLHGAVQDGVCQCESNWKGPICNLFHGCQEGQSLFGNVCTNNVCQHGGSLAVGNKTIECICPVPWDGKYCERLACWRKTDHGAEKRYRNSGDHCVCSNYYKGENCDEIISCLNDGTLDGSRCRCPDGFGGEICEKKCPKGQLTCSTCSLRIFGSVLLTLLFFLMSR